MDSMKRVISTAIAMVLTASMLISCGNAGADNSEAASDRAELSSPDYDESQHIGSFIFWPYEDNACPMHTKTVTLYFKKNDVVAGNGHIGIYEKDTDKKFAEISMKDTDDYSISAATDSDKEYTGWDSGTTIVFNFNKSFEAGKSYYMTWDKGIFMLKNDNSITSRQITKTDNFSFRASAYGVTNNEDPDGDNIYAGKAGDTLDYNIVTDGKDVVSAKVINYDKDSLELSSTEFSGSSSPLTVKLLKAGDPEVQLQFLDKNGSDYAYIYLEFNIEK